MAYADDPENVIDWFKPKRRNVFLPDRFHVPKRLGRFLRQGGFEVVWNQDFRRIMQECAIRPDGSWINDELVEVYSQLHEEGGAKCLSLLKDGVLVGGIYGVHMGGVFMAESMFSRVPNASSVALVILMAGLTKAGVEMVDVQFANPHLTKFNPVLLPGKMYDTKLQELLHKNVELKADYFCFDVATEFVQSLTQTS